MTETREAFLKRIAKVLTDVPSPPLPNTPGELDAYVRSVHQTSAEQVYLTALADFAEYVYAANVDVRDKVLVGVLLEEFARSHSLWWGDEESDERQADPVDIRH